MTWEVNNNMVSKSEAIVRIQELAKQQGVSGVFKVYYDGNIVSSPDTLPDSVDMTLIKISETLDQA